jgi:hypothetical protein
MTFCHSKSIENDTALLHRAAGWSEHLVLESLSAEALQQITRREGIDFATALLFDRFKKSSQYADFIRQIDALRQSPAPLPNSTGIKARVVLVPGALYAERPDLGGDGMLIKELLTNSGWPWSFVPLASSGSIFENARRIREWLLEHSEEKIILVSLSKGGTDLSVALAESNAPSVFRNVVAWVNVCGPLDGSRMANWVLASRLRTYFFQAQFWLQRRDFKLIMDLRHKSDPNSNLPLLLPNLKILHIVGFPLRRHMTTPFSRFCHRKLSVYGPNDGTISLSDLHTWPGKIYPVWGVDHYFRPEGRAREIIAAIFKYLVSHNESKIPVSTNQTLTAPARASSGFASKKLSHH